MTIRTPRSCSALLLGALLAACAAGPRTRPDELSEHATALPALSLTAETRKVLDAKLAAMTKSRVVLLGEPDHYIHEKYEYQLLFVRYLFEHGLRGVGFELGRATGKRLDRYLETGDESWLHAAKDDAARRTTPSGILQFDAQAAWLKNDGLERSRFLRALRQLNETRPAGSPALHVFGFDVDFFASAGYADLDAQIAGDALAPLRAMIVRTGDELAQAEQIDRALAWMHAQSAPVAAAVGAARADELVSSLQNLAASLRFNAVSMHAPSLAGLRAAYAIREQNMFREMDERLARSPDKLALIGHNMHLCKDSPSVRFETDRPMWPSIGTYLAKQLGDDLFGVWMLYARGEHGAVKCPSSSCAITPPPDVLEDRLAQLGKCLLLGIDGKQQRPATLFGELRFMQNGQLGTGRIGRQADLILFVDEVHAPAP